MAEETCAERIIRYVPVDPSAICSPVRSVDAGRCGKPAPFWEEREQGRYCYPVCGEHWTQRVTFFDGPDD